MTQNRYTNDNVVLLDAARLHNAGQIVDTNGGPSFFWGEHGFMGVAFHPSPSAYLVGQESLGHESRGVPGIFMSAPRSLVLR